MSQTASKNGVTEQTECLTAPSNMPLHLNLTLHFLIDTQLGISHANMQSSVPEINGSYRNLTKF
ncbi:hypothetical protein Ciccas_012838 [Cichlidogyrus casuarinus]|uniref:Uncharacterized protein n=1 Tax=Cichlidogyrus casuarinus TaxID=1844966 RepID=A0ABD2PM95_9PLAT